LQIEVRNSKNLIIFFTGGKPELAQITGGKDILTLCLNFCKWIWNSASSLVF